MRTGKDRVQLDAMDVPVLIGGTKVSPGDLLLGDADGVVAVPRSREAEVVALAKEIEEVRLFKIECPRAANKLRALIAEGGDAIEAPFDGEEAITLLADLDAGATGSMTSGMIVDQIKPVIEMYHAGDVDGATDAYGRVAMAINHENRQCGWQSCKAAMVEGGVIRSEFCRHPIPPLHPAIRQRMIDLLKPLDPLVLKWGK